MTLNDFILTSNEEKVRLLYENGVYIGKCRQGGRIVLLYQLEGFYAEVYYRSYRRHIERISCFATTTQLDPYLEEIDVEHLV